MAASEGEAWGLLQTLKWLMSMDLDCVIIEMDCKRVVDDLHNSKLDRSEYGSIISQCRTLLSFKNNYKVVFTRRQSCVYMPQSNEFSCCGTCQGHSVTTLVKSQSNKENRKLFDDNSTNH